MQGEAAQNRQPGIAFIRDAAAGSVVQVGPALGAEPLAIRLAERIDRQSQHELLPADRGQIQHGHGALIDDAAFRCLGVSRAVAAARIQDGINERREQINVWKLATIAAPATSLMPLKQTRASLNRRIARERKAIEADEARIEKLKETTLSSMASRGLAMTPEQLDGVYLAGGFGSYLDPESAAAIGMLPRTCAGKLRTLGNTALTGAATLTLDSAQWQRIRAISRACSYLELSGRADFAAAFTENLSFPQP